MTRIGKLTKQMPHRIKHHLIFPHYRRRISPEYYFFVSPPQIANHSGYVQVDWKKVEKDVNKAKKHLKKKANKAVPEINTFIEEVKVPVTKLALLFMLLLISY